MILSIVPGDRGTTIPVKTAFLSGADLDIPEPASLARPGASGVLATPTVPAIADGVSAAPLRAFADLFYFRIWPLPAVLDVQNPKRGLPIEFQLWNAYLEANNLLTLTPTNADGLTLDVAPIDTFQRLELRTAHAVIGADAPNQIDATFLFGFSEGNALLRLLAVLSDIIPIIAEANIAEKLEWKTDVLTNYDGSEQRIALRQRPRRTLSMDYTLTSDADRKAMYDKIFKTANLTVVAPSYQYQSRVKVATVVADNKLYTNPRRADLRVGESVLITTKTGLQFLYEVDEVFADHVTITTAFSQVIEKGAMVCAAFDGRYTSKPGLSMNALGGKAQLGVLLTNPRPQVAWPDAVITIALFNGRPLLLKRPYANEEANEEFDMNVEVIDNTTGKPAYYSSWTQPFINGERQYLIQTLFEPDELEFWRNFLDLIKGKQKSFYTPTYREDLIRDDTSPFLVGEITVMGTEYATLYFGKPPYMQLQIETDVGTYEVGVADVVNLGDRTRITFSNLIPDDVSHATVSRISYLMRVRFGSDEANFAHYPLYSILNTSIRTVVE